MVPDLPLEVRETFITALRRLDPGVHAEVVSVLARIYAPPCELNCWRWCEKFIRLTPEESRERPGLWTSVETIYVRRVMEFITTPRETEFIIRKSSQLGFTLAYLLIICYLAATAPTHVLYGMDSKESVKKISVRLKRLLEKNESLSGVLTGHAEDTLLTSLLRLRGMDVVLAGSGSEGQYASMPAGLVILDELDLHQEGVKSRVNTIDAARERIKEAKLGGKLIAGGKPQEWDSETNKNYRTGTREHIYVPCLRCGHMQPFEFDKPGTTGPKRFRFEHCKDLAGAWDTQRVLEDTHFICANELCGARIDESDKAAMLRQYQCVVTNHGQDDDKPFPGRVSMWVNDLYSLSPNNAWGKIALSFIGATDHSKLRAFFNGRLALPQEDSRTEVRKSDLAKLNGGYAHGCIPKRPAINAAGNAAIYVTCDVQGSGQKKWVKIGVTPTGEVYVIDYGMTLHLDDLKGEAAEPVWLGNFRPPEAEIEAVKTAALRDGADFYDALRARFPDREFFVASAGGIDEGYDTFTVRDFCYNSRASEEEDPFFWPFKGIPRAHAKELVNQIEDTYRTGKTEDTPYITVCHFSDDDLKSDLYIGRIAGFDAIKSGKSTMPRLWFPAYCDDDFLTELMQEKRAQIKHRGRLVWMWVPPTKPNDWGDALKIGLALWHVTKSQFPLPETAQAA